MKLAVQNPSDFVAGTFFALVGALCLFVSRDYPMGSATEMGPGYVIRILCWGLILVGAVLLGRGISVKGAAIGPVPIRPPLLILGSIVGYSLLLSLMGFVIASLLLVAVGSYAACDVRFREVTTSALLLTCISVFVFKGILGIPMQLWPNF